MPAVTAFQEGAQFGAEQEARELDIEAGRRRERGINALADEFGPGAQAPQAFGTVTGAGRAERRLASDLEKRKAEAARDVVEQGQADEDRAQDEKLRVAGLVVGSLKAAQKKGVPMDQAVAGLSPALADLGASPEEVGNLPANIAGNPQLLDQMEGALRFSQTKRDGVDRAYGQLEEIVNEDGSVSLWQHHTLSGLKEVSRGGRKLSGALRERKLEQGAPGFKGAVEEAKVLGKGRGKIGVRELPQGPKAKATAKLILEGQQQKAKFFDQTVTTAIKQAEAAWVTGIGSYTDIIRGGKSGDLKATVSTIQALVGFAELERMRKNSPTGAALGPVSDAENLLLQAAMGNLLASQSEEQFLTNMRNLQTQRRLSFKRIAKQYEIDFGVPYAGEGSPLDLPLAQDRNMQSLVDKYRTQGAQ